MFPGMGGMGGGLALNQLLVQMDGVDEPPFLRKYFTNRLNTFLDATYFVPRRIGKLPLRLRPPRPRSEQVYFIGATNVPLDALDPALIRPGRMGRHIWFRTPTKDDREDIFDLYLGAGRPRRGPRPPERRDELARMTNGYSPAMIEQVCSMALTYAHSDGRHEFDRTDIVEAMTTIESGTAIGVDYVEEETRAVAIHEAGHAVASHVYMARRALHAPVDPDARRLARPPPGDREGGALHAPGATRRSATSSGRSARWPPSTSSTARTRSASAATSQSATWRAARMVGMCGMGPEPLDLSGRVDEDEREEAEKRSWSASSASACRS